MLPHAQPLPEGMQGRLKRRSSSSEKAGETSESRPVKSLRLY
jgi:hypothetical protein|tara:strand:- start:316 stop:441 length:126 start_codon:yes stop_codon:yes gene_type:complete